MPFRIGRNSIVGGQIMYYVWGWVGRKRGGCSVGTDRSDSCGQTVAVPQIMNSLIGGRGGVQ